ncbi:MAG: hypothetical protein ACRDOO_19340, partial [Actinomadura sp.]
PPPPRRVPIVIMQMFSCRDLLRRRNFCMITAEEAGGASRDHADLPGRTEAGVGYAVRRW